MNKNVKQNSENSYFSFKPSDIHHIAIICSNYNTSLRFYLEVVGLELLGEVYREDRKSWKADLGLQGKYLIELFSFPDPPQRISQPEATGLRHLAFAVQDIEEAAKHLKNMGVQTEAIRVDEYTKKRFFFFEDPDKLPIEFYAV
jgi:glyoxylase I family protein